MNGRGWKRRLTAIGMGVLAVLAAGGVHAQATQTMPVANVVSAPSAALDEATRGMLIQAREDYNAGDAERSAEIYEKLAEEAPQDARLLYNLGTAYAKQGRNGMAAWRFLQALELAPRDRETRMNLKLVAPEIFEQTAFSPFPPLNMLYGRLSMNEWAALAGASLAVLLLIGTAYAACAPGARGRRSLRAVGYAAVAAVVFTWPLAISRYYQDAVVWKGIIVEKDLSARAAPGDRQAETFPLPEGSLVVIKRAEQQDWLFVSDSAGKKQGFVRRDFVRFL